MSSFSSPDKPQARDPLAHTRTPKPGAGSTLAALWELTKPRLCAFSVLSSVTAYAAARPVWSGPVTWAMVIGTTLSAAGALSLNQWRERDLDALMERTRHRPLPTGRIGPGLALAWGTLLSIAGCGVLFAWVNPLATALSAATILLYLFAYTPLKRSSPWATELGAIPGALPCLLGWAAAGKGLSALAWLLFALQYFWQMPHFLAIGWIHRDDYRRAGFPLRPTLDASGATTAKWSFGYSAVLLLVAVIPCLLGRTGAIYGSIAITSSAAMLLLAWRFMTASADRFPAARRLFAATLVYLPLVQGSLVLDRWF